MLVSFARVLIDDMRGADDTSRLRLFIKRGERCLPLGAFKVSILRLIRTDVLGDTVGGDPCLGCSRQVRLDVVLCTCVLVGSLGIGFTSLRGNVPAVSERAVVNPVGEVRAHRRDGEVVHEGDDCDEDGQRRNAIGHDAVDLLGKR